MSAAAIAKSLRTFTTATKSFKLPDLPYDFGALEPVISGEIMKLHHSKHHQAYVTNLNASLEKYADAEAKNDVASMIALQPAIRFNGGGHVNHSIFWQNLAPQKLGGGEFSLASADLKQAIDTEFGGYEKMVEKLSAASVGVQGSGWGWLGYNKATGKVQMATMANQDPLSTVGLVPLLGIDVWEHAYYLQYKNVRGEYLKEIWKVINWADVSARLAAAKQ